MNQKRAIDSCIDSLTLMLVDSNNELSSEQQRKLRKGVRDLKRLKRASRLTHRQVIAVVDEIARAVFEILTPGRGE